MQSFPGQQVAGPSFSPTNDWLLNQDTAEQKGVQIDVASRDSGSVPTTTLRAGLLMGIVTATKLWKQYDDGASDGTEVAKGILLAPVKLLDPYGAASVAPVSGTVIMAKARVRASLLFGYDAAGKADLIATGHGFIFEADFE